MLVGSFIYSCVYPPLHAMEINWITSLMFERYPYNCTTT
nr:MAG TPA: hypothetical protein [Caudoviricetes sp.]